MTIEKIEIMPHKKRKQAFLCVLYSVPTNAGITRVEIICTQDTLRQVRNAINQALEEDELTKAEQNSEHRIGRLKDFGK